MCTHRAPRGQPKTQRTPTFLTQYYTVIDFEGGGYDVLDLMTKMLHKAWSKLAWFYIINVTKYILKKNPIGIEVWLKFGKIGPHFNLQLLIGLQRYGIEPF